MVSVAWRSPFSHITMCACPDCASTMDCFQPCACMPRSASDATEATLPPLASTWVTMAPGISSALSTL